MFVNRIDEIKILQEQVKNSKFISVLGKRRVGKTSLILKAIPDVLYSQSVDTTVEIQIKQFCDDLPDFFRDITPKTWSV